MNISLNSSIHDLAISRYPTAQAHLPENVQEMLAPFFERAAECINKEDMSNSPVILDPGPNYLESHPPFTDVKVLIPNHKNSVEIAVGRYFRFEEPGTSNVVTRPFRLDQFVWRDRVAQDHFEEMSSLSRRGEELLREFRNATSSMYLNEAIRSMNHIKNINQAISQTFPPPSAEEVSEECITFDETERERLFDPFFALNVDVMHRLYEIEAEDLGHIGLP